jgi:hypothetical protein
MAQSPGQPVPGQTQTRPSRSPVGCQISGSKLREDRSRVARQRQSKTYIRTAECLLVNLHSNNVGARDQAGGGNGCGIYVVFASNGRESEMVMTAGAPGRLGGQAVESHSQFLNWHQASARQPIR